MNRKRIIYILGGIGLPFLFLCIIIVVYYLIVSVNISHEVYNLIDSSFEHHGENYMEYADIISEDNYIFLDYSRGFNENWAKNYHTIPVVSHDFKKAKAYYQYTIDGNTHGGYRIRVTISLEYKDGKWCVTNVDEHP